MRILYVIDSLGVGGAESSLVAMAPYLIGAGLDLHVLPLGQASDLRRPLEDQGVTVHHRSAPLGRLANYRTVEVVIRSIQPDLVHTTLFESNIAGRAAGWRSGIPVVSSIVNDVYDKTHRAEANRLKLAVAQAIDVATCRLVDRFHLISAAIAASVAPRLHIDPRRITVVPRGRDPEAFPFRTPVGRTAARHRLGVADGQTVVLALGRHEPQKALDVLIQATNHLVPELPEIVVLLAGREGRSTAVLRDAASRTPAEVRFLGARPDVADLLTAADVLAFPSEREGFGGVLIEAMAVGCPVVASAIPTSLEVLGGDGSEPSFFPPGEPERLAAAVRHTLDHPDHTRALLDHRHQRFLDRFTITGAAAGMVQLYEGVIESQHR